MGSKKRLAALLLCLFLLAGCQGKALPSGMGEEALLSGGREVLLSGSADGKFYAYEILEYSDRLQVAEPTLLTDPDEIGRAHV